MSVINNVITQPWTKCMHTKDLPFICTINNIVFLFHFTEKLLQYPVRIVEIMTDSCKAMEFTFH